MKHPKGHPPNNQGCIKYAAIIYDLGIRNSAFSTRLQIETWNNLTTAKLLKCSLETLIVTDQLRVVFRSRSKENGVSSAKGRVLLVIGRALPIPWPPRSPDVASCDFYLWGYVKDQGYQPPMPHSLRERNSQAIAKSMSQLRRAWEEFEYRIDIFRATNGASLEKPCEFPCCFQAVSRLYL
jgi:hypothetical protein